MIAEREHAMRRLLLSVAALAGALALSAAAAAEVPTNVWTPLGDGTFALPEKGYPNLTGPAFCWVPDRDFGLVAPILSETEAKSGPGLRRISFDDPKWTAVAAKGSDSLWPDTWDSPKAYCYLPGLKKVLVVKQEWWYSRKRQPVAGWLIDPADGSWEPMSDPTSMSDRSKDFEPVPGRDGLRLPIWGAVVFDAHNREAVSFGGGGVWGRVGKEKEKVAAGDWIFDEAAKRIRRLTDDDKGKVTEARKWYPGHCGTWLFAEADKKWRPLERPLGEQPSGRILPGMAYDAGEKKIVLFGGDDLARCFGDTWVYDCVKRSWSRVGTKSAPTARSAHAMVYVPDQNVILMAGGYAGGWRPLKDVWIFETAKGQWTRLGLDLPAAAGQASADYDAKRKVVVLAAYPGTRGNKKVPVYTLKLDAASAPKASPEAADQVKDWHCKAWNWGSLLPDEWEDGANKPGDPNAGKAALAALPANTWTDPKPPVLVPMRGWGSYVYDIRSHKGFAWGGGHSTYPGAEISEYDVLTNRWRSMAQPTNYNPIWLHGMVAGPPGLSFGGWSLLPSHARKSYGVDPVSGMVVTYAGDIYDPKHHGVTMHIGDFPMDWGGPAYQVAYVTAGHGLYGFAAERSSKGTGWLCRADVAAGRWEVVDKAGPAGHNEHDFLVWDSERDRLLYFRRDKAALWTFDFKSKQWAEEAPSGKAPPQALGDGTYIPEMDAVLLVFGSGQEAMYFYKCGEKKWYTAPYQGAAAARGNSTGRDLSPIYDPELKVVARFFENDSKWMGVRIMRLDPAGLKLAPVE